MPSGGSTTFERPIWTHCSPRRVHLPLWRKQWERLLTNPLSRTAVFVAVSLVLTGCGKHTDDDESRAGTPVPDITVAKVQRAVIAQDLIVSGNLAALPNHDAKAAPLVPGRIARVMV